MMLCDHIVFWMEHNARPGFASEFEMLVYEIRCSIQLVADGMRRQIAAMPAVAKAFQQMAEAMNRAAPLEVRQRA